MNGLYCQYSDTMESSAEVGSEFRDTGNRMANLKSCSRCGYTWFSNVKSPVRCPSCGSHCWDKPPDLFECQMCGHLWYPRTQSTPLRCPSCKTRSCNSYYGDHPKLRRASQSTSADKVLKLYSKGSGCVAIAMSTGIPLSTVFDIVRSTVGDVKVKM